MIEYRVGDAIAHLEGLAADSAAVIHLDDAWARPGRNDQFGVTYPTHDFETTTRLLAACQRVLEPGGWLIADADAWLLPRLIDHLRETWGDGAASYGGGYRKTGRVTYLTDDGAVDRSGPGWYLSGAGYPVVFAVCDTPDDARMTQAAASQLAQRPRETFGWSSVKPVAPYRAWLDGFAARGERIVVPCAGTAPAAIAAEQLWGDDAVVECVDVDPDAREAYHERRRAVLATPPRDQATLAGFADTPSDPS